MSESLTWLLSLMTLTLPGLPLSKSPNLPPPPGVDHLPEPQGLPSMLECFPKPVEGHGMAEGVEIRHYLHENSSIPARTVYKYKFKISIVTDQHVPDYNEAHNGLVSL